MAEIEAIINEERDPDWSTVNRDCIASLIKKFIRELPEPLFTYPLYDSWKDLGASDIADRFVAYSNELTAIIPNSQKDRK